MTRILRKQVVPAFHTITQVDDISLWPERTPKELIDYWAGKCLENLHHNGIKSLDAKFAMQKVGCKCTQGMFERWKRNGEVVIRSWICYSPANGRVSCFFCKLMGVAGSQFTYDGFCDRKHACDRLGVHEQSKDHTQEVLSATSHLAYRLFICTRRVSNWAILAQSFKTTRSVCLILIVNDA